MTSACSVVRERSDEILVVHVALVNETYALQFARQSRRIGREFAAFEGQAAGWLSAKLRWSSAGCVAVQSTIVQP